MLLAAALVGVSELEVWVRAGGGTAAAALTLGLASALVFRGRYPIATTCLVAVGLTLCAYYAGEPFWRRP